ncbi:MAG: SDR family NAD(P)-dependent oxidoreductase [Nocardioidaceae bacterium]|nr:SDR family NAD(P)-dependent oxidoreductase [Nocardioidaceae bacterium]
MQQQPIGPAAPPGRTSRALVTGATAGLGLAFARALAGRGHRLVLVARDAERLQAVAGELMHRWHVDATVLVADLSTEDGTARVAAVLADDSVPVDVLVNSAGFGQRLPFGDNDVSAEQRSLDVHVRAPLLLCHAVLPGMRARGHGVIVNVSSIAGWLPRGTYGAHKAWLTSFTRWLDIAYRLEGVRAMAVCPGLVHTEFHQRMGVDMAGVPRWMWLDADSVVSEALRDLAAGVRVSVPSRRYRLLMRLAAVVPDGWVAGVARRGR